MIDTVVNVVTLLSSETGPLVFVSGYNCSLVSGRKRFCLLATQEHNGAKPERPAAAAKPAVVDVDMEKEKQLAAMVCSLENKDACLMCGS